MKKLIAISFFASSLLFASNIDTNETINKMVQDVIPGTEISKIEKGEIDGLYKAFMPNGDLLYIEPNKKLIFLGQVWSDTGVSLTQNDVGRWQQELVEKQIENLDSKQLVESSLKIILGKGLAQYDFVIFTDPECPYCHKAEDVFKNKDVTVYFNYMPLEFHKNAKTWSLDILSSKNPKQTAADIRNGKVVKVSHTKDAEAKLNKMIELAKTLNVIGTPKLFVIDKRNNKIVKAINGANIPQIEKYLK